MILARVLALALELSRVPDQSAVDAIVEASRAAGVPRALALAVCTVESGLGTRGAILCGCYVRRTGVVDTSTAAQARCVAGTLRAGWRACGSWAGALRRYRYGLADHGCPLADPRRYVDRVGAYTRRMGLVL